MTSVRCSEIALTRKNTSERAEDRGRCVTELIPGYWHHVCGANVEQWRRARVYVAGFEDDWKRFKQYREYAAVYAIATVDVKRRLEAPDALEENERAERLVFDV